MFERLRAVLKSALDAATPVTDPRERARLMREAVVEARVSVQKMHEALARTEAELASERKRLEDAERRMRLAQNINDQETVDVAERFAAKHRDRIEVLERKGRVQRDELALAEREMSEMRAQLQAAAGPESSEDIRRAWRELERLGATRSETDLDDELRRAEMDRAAREALAEQQLEALKRKMRGES